MTERGAVTWHDTSPKGLLVGMLVGLTAGTILAVLLLVFSIPATWALLAVPGCMALFGLSGIVESRREPHTAVFTADQVRLVSRLATRIRSSTELNELTVRHTGDAEQGYRKTELRLSWLDASSEVRMTDDHDPELAPALAQLLGPAVGERWTRLDPPLDA